MSDDKTFRPYDGETFDMTDCHYYEFEKLFKKVNPKIDLNNLIYSFDPIPITFQYICFFGKALH